MINEQKATTIHIRIRLLLRLVGGDCTTNNVRSVVSISGGLGSPFNHGLRGAEPLYHHWTVSRANCGYISLSPWPEHRNDLLACCTVTPTHTHTQSADGVGGGKKADIHMFSSSVKTNTCAASAPETETWKMLCGFSRTNVQFSNSKKDFWVRF